MKRYHLNDKGLPGACKAEKRGCPYGGASEHVEVDSISEARAWAEKRIAEDYNGTFGVSNKQAAVLSNSGIESFSVSSEHKEHNGKFYGYVAIKLKDRDEPVYVPQDTKGNLVNDLAVWKFIEDIPQELFKDKDVLEVFSKTFRSASAWAK